MTANRIYSIFQTRFIAFLHYLLRTFKRRWLEISVSILIIIGIVLGGYFLFLRGARFLLNQGDLGRILLDRIFYLGWSIIFYLLILSNIITSFSTLYRSPEVAYLFTVPLSFIRIFRIKYLENALYSSWAILVLGLPMTMAYGKIYSISPPQMLAILLFGLVPYLLIGTAFGLIIMMGVVRLSQWFRMRSVFIVLGLLFLGIFWIYFNTSQRGINIVGDMGSFRALDRYMFNLSQPPFPLIPSYWFTELFNFSADRWTDLFLNAGLLITTGLIGYEAASAISAGWYHKTYQIMEGSASRSEKEPADSTGLMKRLPGFQPGMRGLIFKDILTFVRTPQQWFQFLMFGFLISIYLLNLSRADVRFANLTQFWRILIYLFNFGFCGFVMVALTTRFVFPLISLEGRGLWILKSAPIDITRLFREKFWLSFAIFFPLAEIIALISNHFLSQSIFISFITTVFLMLISVALISLSLGLGAVFAQYDESNPMKISSSAGGIITIVISLFYVCVMVGSLVGILYLAGADHKGMLIALPVSLVVVINILIIMLPLRWGYRAIQNFEI